ncbi:MAG: hypothetical protein M1131_06965 [Actinobacteria bacterium]|jgi:tetratricopeptide (TPR) repeat protein|nr:hypothetical protein [Actinomycetota bacterium]MCL6094484.1 hypothetical protein [Actinomycetota bacterium]
MAEEEDREELDMLVRSLEDLEQEFENGEVSEADYRQLRIDYLQRIAERLSPLHESQDSHSETGTSVQADSVDESRGTVGGGALSTAVVARTGRLHRAPSRKMRLLVATAGFLIVAVVGVVGFATNRLPGQTPTGSLRLDKAQRIKVEISQAASLVDEGKDVQAMAVYSKVLKLDSSQPQALAGLGWLEYEAGASAGSKSLVAKGERSEEKALAVDPSFAYGHLYLAAILFSYYKEPGKAASQLEEFIADHPSTQLVAEAYPLIVKVFAAIGHPLPKSLSMANSKQ